MLSRLLQIPARLCLRVAAVLMASTLIAATGCSKFHPMTSREYVYVAVKQIALRDRVAVVANHVADVSNGEQLQVLEHGRRFLRVKTPQGQEGWIEDHAVINQDEYNQFQNLAKQHAQDVPVATAVLYSELFMHLEPGRKTQRFYLLTPNTKVSLLERASVQKVAQNSVLGLPAAAGAPVAIHGKAERQEKKKSAPQSFDSQFATAVPMEDWWLVRDDKGRTGWMLARDLDVDVPQDVAQYAESEKMIGAYVLRFVQDPDSGKPDGKVPEYLTVLTPYKQGLPYDFDQVRVFTWDTARHRYGTAFRLRDIAGFFPVKVTPATAAAGGGEIAPEFSIQSAANNAVHLDPQTGVAKADQLETITFRLEGNLVRKVVPGGAAATSAAKAEPVSRAPGHAARHRTAHPRRHHR